MKVSGSTWLTAGDDEGTGFPYEKRVPATKQRHTSWFKTTSKSPLTKYRQRQLPVINALRIFRSTSIMFDAEWWNNVGESPFTGEIVGANCLNRIRDQVFSAMPDLLSRA